MENLYNNIIDLYKQLDDTTKAHYLKKKKQPPCAKGCSSCCSQFFEISELEFSLIFEEIERLSDEKKARLAQKSQYLFSLFQEHWPSFYNDYFTSENSTLNTDDYYKHPERFEVTLPCMFLSDEGNCEIYEQRPIICRTTGIGYQQLVNFGSVCNYIKGITTPFWQADLRPLRDDIDLVRWLDDPEDSDSYKRQYPMFYYVYDLLIQDNSQKYYRNLESYKL